MKGTHSTEPITADSLVQNVVEHHPQTVVVFAHHRMLCFGCYVAPHHTIADCAREHSVAVESLLQELNQALVTAAT